MNDFNYIMEDEEESRRLDWKTDTCQVRNQAVWAKIQPGMRVADLGCGSGKTTHCLNELVQPGGGVIGVDISEQRIRYAREHYRAEGLTFVRKDIRESLDDLGLVDFIWIRFVLEYHLGHGLEILKNVTRILRPGGIVCMIDLDLNCLCHYGMPPRLEKAVRGVMETLERHAQFDPFVGRKLYSYCYDLGFRNIDLDLTAHHLFFGEIKESDMFNWTRKVKIAARQSGYGFKEYGGDFDRFYKDFERFFTDPRRFTYTPLIACRAVKP